MDDAKLTRYTININNKNDDNMAEIFINGFYNKYYSNKLPINVITADGLSSALEKFNIIKSSI